MEKYNSSPPRPIDTRVLGIGIALLASMLVAGYALKNSFDKRLAAIEQKITALEIPLRPVTVSADQPPSSGTQPRTGQQQPWPEAARVISSGRSRQPKSIQEQQHDASQRQQARLTALQTSFEDERVDNAWAAQTELDIHDMLTNAVATSGFIPSNSSVECKSSSCRIAIDMTGNMDPEDLLLQLSVDMSEMLPRSKTVTLPDGKGGKRLSIFATR